MQEDLNGISREMEILRNNQKEMLEIKNVVPEMKMTLIDSPVD